MLTSAFEKNFFSEDDTKAFLDKLFENAEDIFPQDVQEIHAYTKKFYSSLLKENKKSQLWQQPLLNWLNNYGN